MFKLSLKVAILLAVGVCLLISGCSDDDSSSDKGMESDTGTGTALEIDLDTYATLSEEDTGTGMDTSTETVSQEVAHPDSRLIWLRCPLGKTWDGAQCNGSASSFSWYEALTACPAGYRLPTKQEFVDLLGGCEDFLGGLACTPCASSHTCRAMFPAEDNAMYWTSSSYDDDEAWGLVSSSGVVADYYKSEGFEVRCARPGPAAETDTEEMDTDTATDTGDVVGCDGVLSFTDERLEQAIHQAIEKLSGNLTGADVAGVTELDLSGRSFSSLEGIECLTALKSLDLNHCMLSDVSPLSSLTALTDLNLGSNYISDVSPLSGLTALTELHLDHNKISDVSPLSGLMDLTELHLGSNYISDVSPLSSLTALMTLSLMANNISDVSPLSSLTALTDLNLGYNWISDASVLSHLTVLTDLDLRYNLLSEVPPLAGLSVLTELYLNDNQISGVGGLSNLTGLTRLSLMYNQVSDLSPLVENPGLGSGDWVYLQSNPIDCTAQAANIAALRDRGAELSIGCP